jgi:TetR/AcrR family transcriptional repressor of nem operon
MPSQSKGTARYGNVDSRARLLSAAEDLLWDRGVSGTTPRAVWETAATGQGSYYHHFPSKAALVHAALDRVVTRSLEQAGAGLQTTGPLMQAVRHYLLRPREAVRGCQIGRHASDHVVMTTPGLSAVVQRYFDELHALISGAVSEARDHGENVPAGLSPAELADVVVATVQGGYVMARATGDQAHMDRAVRGLAQLLDPSPHEAEGD